MKLLYPYKATRNIISKCLPLLVITVLFSACYTNKSIMLKTPEDYPFAIYNDSLNNRDTYKVAVADIIQMNVYTNEGRQRLGISFDPMVNGQAQTPGMTGQGILTYTVEPDSTINVPLLGRVKVAGLSIRETEFFLESKFANYYNLPYVELRVTNRRFMVFVGGNDAKVINMLNEKTTLIEGLALAGGISPLSKAANIKLIRGSLSNPVVYQIDLSTLEGARLGGSMVLQANDIIYVEPVKRNVDQVIQQSLIYVSSVVSIFTLVFTIISLSN